MFEQTDVTGIDWPPVATRPASALMAMLYHFNRSQWQAADELVVNQFRQLSLLVSHAIETVPFYRERLAHLQNPVDPEALRDDWHKIPILTRTEVQSSPTSLKSASLPKDHGSIHSMVTSGSTGQPLNCLGTQITRFFWQCVTLRDHDWHRRDFSKTLAAIRHADRAEAPDGRSYRNWGTPVNLVHNSGSSALLTTDSTVNQQVEWLRRVEPGYLIAYPSCVRALSTEFLKRNQRLPGLIQVRSFGEILEPETRDLCYQAWRVPVVDCYSSQEVGYVALECPDNPETYHVQSETVFVEILDERGNQCQEGQIGRVVATPLHNAAMPLIRYDLQDFAEVGDNCACGRGLPALRRIVGRQRNMVTLPNGEQRWPGLGRGEVLAQLPPIQQYQIVQVSLDTIEVRLVQSATFSSSEERQIQEFIRKNLGYPFDVQLRYVHEIKRGRNGKFEEFISQL